MSKWKQMLTTTQIASSMSLSSICSVQTIAYLHRLLLRSLWGSGRWEMKQAYLFSHTLVSMRL